MRKAKKIIINKRNELTGFHHLEDGMIIYRYMEGSYLKKMDKDKKIFLNFLANYKEGELTDAQRDVEEGKIHQTLKIGNHTINNGNYAFDNLLNTSGAISVSPFAKNVTLKNVTILSQHEHNNFYSLCCTHVENDKIDFGEKEHIKGKLVIKDLKKFLYFFEEALEKEGIEIYGANKCKYIDERKVTYTENDDNFFRQDPAFLKLKIHSYQNEFRILCRHKDNRKIVKTKNIYCPKALKYCEFEYIEKNTI